MEALFNVWHSQIEQVLTEHEQIRREADSIGPDVELQYWKNRMDKFHMYAPIYLQDTSNTRFDGDHNYSVLFGTIQNNGFKESKLYTGQTNTCN